MGINICHSEIKKNITTDCSKPLQRGYEPIGLIGLNTSKNVNFYLDTGEIYINSESANLFQIYNPKVNAFEGSITQFEDNGNYIGKISKKISFDIPMSGGGISRDFIDQLFFGVEFVVFLKQKGGRIEAFGLENGLKISEGSRNVTEDGFWRVTLTEKECNFSELFVNEANGELNFNLFTNNDVVRINSVEGAIRCDVNFVLRAPYGGYKSGNDLAIDPPIPENDLNIAFIPRGNTICELIGTGDSIENELFIPVSGSLIIDEWELKNDIHLPNASIFEFSNHDCKRIFAPKAIHISVENSNLTEDAIAILLSNMRELGVLNCYLYVSGGTSAGYSTWTQQMKDDADFIATELVGIILSND